MSQEYHNQHNNQQQEDIKTRNQNKKSITATINNNHREIIAHQMLMKQWPKCDESNRSHDHEDWEWASWSRVLKRKRMEKESPWSHYTSMLAGVERDEKVNCNNTTTWNHNHYHSQQQSQWKYLRTWCRDDDDNHSRMTITMTNMEMSISNKARKHTNAWIDSQLS